MSRRVHRRVRRRRVGLNPLLIHSTLQQIKPITNGIRLAEALGVRNGIDRALNSNPIGRAVKSVGSFLQNTLEYGSKRPERPRCPERPKIRGGSRRKSYRRRGKEDLQVIK